ncbi:MAG: STAS domain-containing protein [Fuerstiella sp.]|nr:STAS domain-containing protein [Fuerstiella sp.]MCP4505250.1 STAS domain-containing protein [Fuerstiella sp.]
MVDFKSYKLDDVPEILVLELTGRLDTENSEHLMNCVQTHIEDGGSRIILNCEDLDFISSLGLGTLLRAMTRLKKLGGSMALAGPRGAVADVLRLVHLNRLLSIHANVDEAATAMKRQS